MSAALFMRGSVAFVCDCINSAEYKYVHVTHSLLESGDTNERLGETCVSRERTLKNAGVIYLEKGCIFNTVPCFFLLLLLALI